MRQLFEPLNKVAASIVPTHLRRIGPIGLPEKNKDCQRKSLRSGREQTHRYQTLGRIHYEPSYSRAREVAQTTNRPLFIIVSENTETRACQEFGRDVLSHPLIVEAAESLFVRVVVDSPASIKRSLRKGNRKGCNSPEVRVVDARSGKDIVPLVADVRLTVGAVASAMVYALKKIGVSIPHYLKLLLEEERAREFLRGGAFSSARDAIFAVPYFWLGEVKFAGIDGVIATEAGWIEGLESVKVTYDSSRLSFGSLVRQAIKQDIATAIYYNTEDELLVAEMETEQSNMDLTLRKLSENLCPATDSKFCLRKTAFRYVPLTDLQSAQVNHLVWKSKQKEAENLLSPRQMEILDFAQSYSDHQLPDAVDVPIQFAWHNMFRHLTQPPPSTQINVPASLKL